MKCEDVPNELIASVDGRANARERCGIEEHLAGCAACRTRAEEFRKLSTVMDELPAIEPSFGFDARLRQRIAAEPRRSRFFFFVPQPRLALSIVLLAALTVCIVKLPLGNPVAQPATTAVQQADFNAINNLGVLENYDVVTKLGALSELVPVQGADSQPKQPSNDGGGV
ncbi:MAG: anti-sigma factor family protein [Candidatus Acidiferrales bacterium]